MSVRNRDREIVLTFYVIVVMFLFANTFFSEIPLCLSGDTPGSTIVYVEPNYIQIPENETGHQFKVNVSIYRATNVYAYDFKMLYNSTLLNGTTINEGSFLKTAGDTFFTIVDFNDEYNSTHGRIWVSCTLLGPRSGVNGTATLVTITFKTKPLTGLSFLDLTVTQLSDPSANSISHHVIDATVYLGTPPQIRVPANYPTIQQAINAATIGTTILVSNGTYFENLVIDKTISIIGENESTTIIDANNSNTALLVTGNSISVKGFTIQNAASYAMHIDHSSFNGIYDNIIKNNGYGICLNNSIQNSVTNNLILENAQDGIQLFGTATIANNTVKLNGRYGININFSYANITGNEIESNKNGICLSYSWESILRKNNLLNNTRNFSVDGEKLSDYVQNVDDSNTINEKTMCYLISQKDVTISSNNFPNIGYLGIINSTNIHVTNLNFTNNGEGILLAFTKNSKIENVNIENNFMGIKCIGCQNDNITQVTFKNNSRGVDLSCYSLNNEISKNNVTNTNPNLGEIGLALKNCNNNTLRGNIIIGYSYAFFLNQASNNTIYHNNIINNSQPIYADNQFNNQWDNGYQGNYWSAYNGTDNNSDGIGDTQYLLDGNQTDRYPLIHPYIPDIAVINVTVNPNKTYVGQTVAVTVFVMNKWYETATFNITVYANSTLIQTLTVTGLTPYNKSTLTFYWNTSHLTPANYTLLAQADILPGEIEINDNTHADCKIETITFNVDFNSDGVVNALDLRKAAIYFGHVGSCEYDLNFDNIINLEDLEIIVINCGDP